MMRTKLPQTIFVFAIAVVSIFAGAVPGACQSAAGGPPVEAAASQAAGVAIQNVQDLEKAQSLGRNVTARRVGGLVQADQQDGQDFGEKILNCLAEAREAKTNICDARNLVGEQSLSADLVFTPANASGLTLLLAGNLTVQQGMHRVIIQPGVTGFAVEGSGSWSSRGNSAAPAGTVFVYNGPEYAWSVVGGQLNVWTMYIRLQDFAILVPRSLTGSGVYLGPEVQDVYLERMRIALPTSGSTGYSLHLYGGALGSKMYSSFAHIDAPEFVGGAGVLVDGADDAYWGQSKVVGGRIMASSKDVAGSTCVNQVQGELSLTDTDVEDCDAGLRIADSTTVHPYVHPDGCCVNTGVLFDGKGAIGNLVLSSKCAARNDQPSEINGAHGNTCLAASGAVYNDLAAAGSNVSFYNWRNVPMNLILAAGKTTTEPVSIQFTDGKSGNNKWSMMKGTDNNLQVVDVAATNVRLQFQAGSAGNTVINSGGGGAVVFNAFSGTANAYVDSRGAATFTGITDSGMSGTAQCAQFTGSGRLVGTGRPCGGGGGMPAAFNPGTLPARWTFSGISPAGVATDGPFGRYTPDVDVSIVAEEYVVYGTPTGCKSNPVMFLSLDGREIEGTRRALNGAGGGYEGLDIAIPQGHVLTIGSDLGQVCSSQAGAYYTVSVKSRNDPAL